MATTSSMTDKIKNYAAFFDLDDTLLKVNSGKALIKEASRQGLMKRRDLLRGLWFSVLYKLNLAHSIRLVNRMASWLKGIKETTFIELSEKICNDYLFDNISERMLQEIEFHRSRNASIILFSAASDYICRPVAEKLNMDDMICSTLEVVDGIFTGLPDGKLVFGREKGERLKSYCEKHAYSLSDAFCYADSFSDFPMLDLVGHPVAVRPDRRLGNAAKRRGWQLISD